MLPLNTMKEHIIHRRRGGKKGTKGIIYNLKQTWIHIETKKTERLCRK